MIILSTIRCPCTRPYGFLAHRQREIGALAQFSYRLTYSYESITETKRSLPSVLFLGLSLISGINK